MGLNLNSLIEASLGSARAGAMTKIAQEGEAKTCKDCDRPAVEGSDFCKQCAEKKAQGEEQSAQTSTDGTEKTATANIIKMANAVQWLVENPGSWYPGAGRLKVAEDMPENKTGPARGPNTLETTINSPVKEQMPAVLNPGGAAKHDIPLSPPMEAGANPKAAPRSMQTDVSMSLPSQPEEGVLIQKESSINALKRAMLAKRAAEGTTDTITTPKTSALPEDQPSQMARPAEVTSQEKMIASNEAAIDFTKGEAKAVPKKRMGEVLEEPAQSKAGDSALQDALGADFVAQGGAKIASARLVQKLASQGCSCERSSLTKGSCGFCKIASQVERELRGRAGAHIAAAQGKGQ